MKKVRVILSAEAKEVYTYLVKEAPKSKREKAILNGIAKKIESYLKSFFKTRSVPL